MSDYGIVRYADEETITIPGGSRVLDRIGTPGERQFLIQVMAEQLGIPSSEAQRPDVLAVVANAAQRTVQFGWQPGIHMHVQPFNTTEEDANGRKVQVKKWVLVDGEKAWKDSADRHRRNGVRFAIITRPEPMTPDELRNEAKALGLDPKDLAINAYGVYAKVVVNDEFEIAAMIYGKEQAFNSIPWAAGIYTGKKKVGRYWNDDGLPTGVTARDVAIRRAHKRALMQSTLPLIPLDDKSESQRINDYTEELRREELHRRQLRAMPAPRPALDAFDEEILNGSAPSGVVSDEMLPEIDFGPSPNGTAQRTQEVTEQPAEPNPFTDPNVGADAPANQATAVDYAVIADGLTGDCKKLADWCAKLHREGNGGPASEPQYNALTRTIDRAAGKGSTDRVLSVLCRGSVTNAKPPSKDMASKLLNFILRQHKPQGASEYTDNPQYRQDYVDCLVNIAGAVKGK